MIEHWFITIPAVLQFQRICGIQETREGPLFDRAAKELDLLCRDAIRKGTQPRGDPPGEIWQARMTLHGKSTRIEITVVNERRPEGDHPQVVRVRNKDERAR